MSFTERFVTIPIRVYDTALKDMANIIESEESYVKIYPFEIRSYRPTVDEKINATKEITSITYKNGDNMWAYMTVKEFEAALDKHVK